MVLGETHVVYRSMCLSRVTAVRGKVFWDGWSKKGKRERPHAPRRMKQHKSRAILAKVSKQLSARPVSHSKTLPPDPVRSHQAFPHTRPKLRTTLGGGRPLRLVIRLRSVEQTTRRILSRRRRGLALIRGPLGLRTLIIPPNKRLILLHRRHPLLPPRPRKLPQSPHHLLSRRYTLQEELFVGMLCARKNVPSQEPAQSSRVSVEGKT